MYWNTANTVLSVLKITSELCWVSALLSHLKIHFEIMDCVTTDNNLIIQNIYISSRFGLEVWTGSVFDIWYPNIANIIIQNFYKSKSCIVSINTWTLVSEVPFELSPNIISVSVSVYRGKKWDLIGWSTKLSYLSTRLSQIPELSWWWHNSLTIIIQRFFFVFIK